MAKLSKDVAAKIPNIKTTGQVTTQLVLLQFAATSSKFISVQGAFLAFENKKKETRKNP